jgi:hypothetical protein
MTNMNLNRALSDIAEIRAQLDRTEAYRGFRSMTVGLSAALVIAGGCLQRFWIEHPEQQPLLFLKIWIGVAFLSAAACTIEMLIRNRISGNPITWKLHRSLISKTMPAILVGSVVTIAAMNAGADQETMLRLLPGLWAMIYGLGLWACGASLPRMAHLATLYFLTGGAVAMLAAAKADAMHPSTMVLLFGVGQMLLAAILFWKIERADQQLQGSN